MRMKKLFALGLMLLIFALAQSWVPTKSVPIDDDVGICFVDNMDQATVDMVFVADNQVICHPDYGNLFSDVEKSDYSISLFSPIDVQYSDISDNKYCYDHTGTRLLSTINRHTWKYRIAIQPWAG